MEKPAINASVGLSESKFADGKPVRSEKLEDGRVRHYMVDGKVRTVPEAANYVLHYESSWMGAEPGDTYEIPVCLFGLSEVQGFLETWNYAIGEVRSYAFDKIVRMDEVDGTGHFTGDEVRAKLGGKPRPHLK